MNSTDYSMPKPLKWRRVRGSRPTWTAPSKARPDNARRLFWRVTAHMSSGPVLYSIDNSSGQLMAVEGPQRPFCTLEAAQEWCAAAEDRLIVEWIADTIEKKGKPT